MSDYEVVIDALRQAGQAAEGAAGRIGTVNAAAALPTGDAGMPGSRLIAELDATRAAWLDRVQTLSRGFAELSGAFEQAAGLYSGNEQAARDQLHIPKTSGPRPS